MFDYLMLLSEGNSVYFGPAHNAVYYYFLSLSFFFYFYKKKVFDKQDLAYTAVLGLSLFSLILLLLNLILLNSFFSCGVTFKIPQFIRFSLQF